MKLSAPPWQYIGLNIFMLIVTFPMCESAAQTRVADSLKVLLQGKFGPEKVDILYELAYELVDVDNESALMYSRLAFESTDCQDSLRLVKVGRIKALAFRRLNLLDSSLELSLKIVPMARKSSATGELKLLLNGIGKVYTEQARYDKALESYWESLELSRQEGDNFDISVIVNNIGIVYYKLMDFDNALKYFDKAIELRRQTERKYDFANILINAAIVHANKNNFTKAISLLKEASMFCGEICTKDMLMQSSYTYGFVAYHNGDLESAEKKFLESLQLATDVGDERLMLDNIVFLADINILKGKLTVAEGYLGLAIQQIGHAGTSFNREILKIYMQLISVYEKLNDHRQVAFYQARYIGLRDSLYSEELASSLMRVQAQHLERESQVKMKTQKELLALNKQIILRQEYLNWAVGTVAFLLLILALVLIRNNKQKGKLNYLLDRKVRERTNALELNQTRLWRACEERDIILNRIVTEIKSSAATVKGLCSLARRDATDVNRYIDEVDFAAERSLRIVEVLSHSMQVIQT